MKNLHETMDTAHQVAPQGGKLRRLMDRFNANNMMKNILWAHRAEMSEADLDYLMHAIDARQCETVTQSQDGRTM